MKALGAGVPPIAVLPLLLIPAILAVVIWQLRDERPRPRLAEILPPPAADYYLRDAVVSTMGPNGQLLHRVRATDVLHYPDRSIRLVNVAVDYLEGPWELVAHNGYMPDDESRLDLQGDVDMQGVLRSGEQVRVRTEAISILFRERRIETAAPLTLSSGRISAGAVGMETDLDGRELQLISAVRVTYAPAP